MVVLRPPNTILKALLLIIGGQVNCKPPFHLLPVRLEQLLPELLLRFQEIVFLQIDIEELATGDHLNTVAKVLVKQVIIALDVLAHALENLQDFLLRSHQGIVDGAHEKLFVIELEGGVALLQLNVLEPANTTS